MKLHVNNNPHFQVLHSLSLWQRISQEDVERNNYSNIMKVIHLTSVYPMANASCEQGFYTMKRVKSDWHSTLGNDTMDMLMRVKIEGPKKQSFIFHLFTECAQATLFWKEFLDYASHIVN